MTYSIRNLCLVLVAATVATSSFALPAAANFVGVSRCNASDGTNTPALHFIDGGNRFIVRAGQSGMTNDHVYNANAAFAWASASNLFPEGTTFGNYDEFICGMMHADHIEAQAPSDPSPVDTVGPDCSDLECSR